MHLLTSLRSSVSISRQSPSPKSSSGSFPTTPIDPISEDGSFTSGSTTPAFQSLPQDLLDGMKPALVLIQAQARKKYYSWEYDPLKHEVWQMTSNERPDEFLSVHKLFLVGTNLVIEGENFERYRISLVEENDNIGRCGVEASGQVLSLNGGQMILTCTELLSLMNLEKFCLLSIFEYSSIFKSITGTVISGLGLQLSDMHVILSSTFNYKDWCEVYLKEEGWVKVWCHIDKVGRKSSGDHRDGRCQIKFYRDKKSTSSKNLVCFIPDCEYVQDVFFYKDCKSHPLDVLEMGLEDFLDRLNTIKVVGNICYPQEGFSQQNRSRSSSSMSFFMNNDNRRNSTVLSSPTSSTSRLKMLSPSRGHQRKKSEVSLDSNHSRYTDIDNCITDPKGLLIRPLAHSGVHCLEAMIRMVIPMMDCAHLYGRPAHFKTERSDLESLMFGLPKLPAVDYFAKEELLLLLEPEIVIDKFPSADPSTVAMRFFTKFLADRMAQNSKRDSKLTFTHLASLAPQPQEIISVSEKLDDTTSTTSSLII